MQTVLLSFKVRATYAGDSWKAFRNLSRPSSTVWTEPKVAFTNVRRHKTDNAAYVLGEIGDEVKKFDWHNFHEAELQILSGKVEDVLAGLTAGRLSGQPSPLIQSDSQMAAA